MKCKCRTVRFLRCAFPGQPAPFPGSVLVTRGGASGLPAAHCTLGWWSTGSFSERAEHA